VGNITILGSDAQPITCTLNKLVVFSGLKVTGRRGGLPLQSGVGDEYLSGIARNAPTGISFWVPK